MGISSNAVVRNIALLGAAVAATGGVLVGANAIVANASTDQPVSVVEANSVTAPATASSDSPTVPTPTASPVPVVESPRESRVKVKFDPNGNDVYDLSNGKVGVGVLPALRFSKNVPDEMRKSVAENFAVVTADTMTPVEGSWAWTGEKTLQFRPEKFWKGRTEYLVLVTDPSMRLDLSKKRVLVLDAPEDGWSFKTARALVGYVNGKTSRMNVYVNGEKVKSFGVSLGKPGWETRSGIKVLSGSKERMKTYTSESLGLTDETYRLTAPWNIRLTPTGEFIHAAPWAYGRIGRFNGSHGCTNMFADDAEWVYKNTIPGDVFVYRGTSKGMESWNGPGGLWNVSDKAWRKAASRPLQ